MSEVEDYFSGNTQAAQTSAVAVMDSDPEQAARSVELGDATGVPPTAIYGDVEGFEAQHKAQLGSSIIGGNQHIADYLNSHPMAPRVSHDDLGQLDNASRAISSIPGASQITRAVNAFKEGFGEFSGKALLSDPLLRRPQDIEFAARHPEASAIMMGVADLGIGPFMLMSKGFSGLTSVVNEFGGREAAAMLEYGLMRGDLNAPGTGGHTDLAHIGTSISAAAPWLRAGKEIPTGIHPALDDLKVDQAKTDGNSLSDALKESLKSATRDRAPDFYANFARSHVGDREIGISADAVRELYGDKQPLADDNMLGWVPGLADKLANAEATGGDVRVPMADWLAKVDPQVADQLHDHLRVRLEGLTIEEGKNLEPKESITEAPQLVRGSAALEPMFSVGDRKVKLERIAGMKPEDVEGFGRDPKELAAESGLIWEDMDRYSQQRYIDASKGTGSIKFGAEQGFHDFELQDETGNKVGSLNISEQKEGKQLYVDMIQGGPPGSKLYDPNFLGPTLIRDLFRQLKAEFPNAESITGHRVSGAREKAESYNKPSASPVIKFEDLADPTKWKSVHEGWTKIQDGVYGEPISMTPEKQKVVDSVNSVLDRIVSKGVGTEGFEKIRTEAGDRASGVYSRYEDAAPWISWSLESGDPTATARHEAVHHLKNSGFFKPEEWDTLSRAARDGGWVEKYGIDRRFDAEKLSNADKLEESIADAYKNWAREPETETALGKIFSRIKELLDSIRTKLKEAFGGDLSAEEIFKKIESGEVGNREPTSQSPQTAFSIEQFRKAANDNLEHRVKELEDNTLPSGKSTYTDNYNAWRSELDRRSKEMNDLLNKKDFSEFDAKRYDKLYEQYRKIDEAGYEDYTKPPKFETIDEDEKAPFEKANAIGMTVDQYRRYQKLIDRRNTEDLAAAQRSAEAYQRKTQTKEWKENRTAMRDQVREEIESRPDVALDQMMAQEKLKFHPDALSDQQKAMLPKEYIQKKNGINPDDAAGYFGYHSGDAMVERLGLMTHDRVAVGMNAREWMNHLIDSETDRRMEQEHGNLDQNILEDAKEQAISATQLDILHEEVLHLGLKAGSEFPISKEQLRQWNREIFDKTPIGDISTDAYLRTAGKAGRAAEMSLLKEDFADAFREKQRQNNAMIMANYAKAYEKSRKAFDRTAKQFRKREVASVPQDWTNWIHDILQRTGNRVNRSVQDLAENIARQPEKTLFAFAEAKEAETFGLRETPIADFLLDPNFRTDMDKLTADQFAGLKQSMDVLAKQGRDEKKVYAAGEAADRDVVLREMREKLGTFPEKTLPDERGAISRAMTLPRMFMAGMTNIETLLNRWDRADPRGIFNRYVSYPMAKASNYKSALEREYAKAYGDLGPIKDGDKFVEAPFADPLSRSEANPEGRPWPGFTRKHVLAMLQNAGNKSNWKVLARGYSTDPEALMSWLHRNTTKEDWDRAQKMGDTLFHSLVDKADTVYENITGATIEKIPLEPVETPHGTYPGWYHPLIADPIRKEVWVKDEDIGQWQRNATGRRGSIMDDSDYFHASTANGYTKRRTGAVYPLDLNFDVVPSRVKQMIHDIAFRDTIIQTEKIFGNKAFQAEVTKHYGETYTDLLMPYLRSMAGAESIASKAGAKAAQVSEYFRQNVISTYIGLNPYTALKHGPTAAIMSMSEVGPKRFLDAARSLYGQSPELGLSNSEFAMKHSEELQRRERHWQDTIAGQHNEIEGASTLREKIIEKGSWLVAQSDMLSAKPTWVAAYNRYIGDGMSHGESIDLADRAVRRAHGSTAATNQPALVRGGGPLHGWLTSVYGFFGTAMQRRIEIAHQLNDTYQLGREGEIKAAAANIPKIATDIMTYVIWPTAVEEWVTGLNQDDKRGAGQRLLSAGTMGIASSVLYLRDLVHAFTTGQEPGVGLLSSPLHDMANAVRDVKKGREAFNRAHAGKTVGDVLTVFGEATGMAPKAIANATKFGIDLVNKQQHPRNAREYVRGFTRGTAKAREEK